MTFFTFSFETESLPIPLFFQKIEIRAGKNVVIIVLMHLQYLHVSLNIYIFYSLYRDILSQATASLRSTGSSLAVGWRCLFRKYSTMSLFGNAC